MAIQVDFEDLKDETKNRLLKEFARKDSIRQLPAHKRKKAMADKMAIDCDPEDDIDCERDEEVNKLADMSEELKPSRSPKVSKSDFASSREGFVVAKGGKPMGSGKKGKT
jgi:hypothetical protein